MNKNYPYKVWFSSIALGPFILYLLLMIFTGDWDLSDFVNLYPYFVFFGAILSLPVLLIFYLASKELFAIARSERLNKLLISFIAIVFMSLIFYLLIGKDAFSISADLGILIPLAYAISILFSALFFRLRREPLN